MFDQHPWPSVLHPLTSSPIQALRWQVISAFDILFEVAVPAAAAAFVWPLKASISTRISVICAFSFRLMYQATAATTDSTNPLLTVRQTCHHHRYPPCELPERLPHA